jgi:hypothetical protein
MADRIVKATITFWYDRLVSGCAVELPGGVARVGWRRTARVRRQARGIEARKRTGMGAAITAPWRWTQVLARRFVQIESAVSLRRPLQG